VAPHAAGKQRFGDVVGGEKFGFGPRNLKVAHAGECILTSYT